MVGVRRIIKEQKMTFFLDSELYIHSPYMMIFLIISISATTEISLYSVRKNKPIRKEMEAPVT